MMRTNVGRRLEVVAAVLAHEAAAGKGLGVVAVGEAVGREKSQVSRALRVLSGAGLVERDPTSLEFVVGRRLLDLAGHAGDPRLLDAAEPLLHRLAAEVGERAGLLVRQGTDALTVETVAGPSALQAVGAIGSVCPLPSSAAGRALLFDDGRERLASLFESEPEAAALDELAARIATERERGVAIADGEVAGDVVFLAAPVRDASAAIRAAIEVSGPRFRLGERIAEATEAVRRAAADVSGLLSAA